jgi:DNA-directed RNA polymerase subunit alpha
VQFSELGAQVHAPSRGGTGDAVLEAKLNTTIAELRLSVRASNCLESEGIGSVRELVQLTEDQLLELRNFGDTTLTEVRERLNEMGLHLGMRVPAAS